MNKSLADDRDGLFLRTIDDMRECMQCVDPYEILGISVLLRKLLLDSTPLVHQVNRARRLKLFFLIGDPDSPFVQSTRQWSGVYPATRGGTRWLLFVNHDGRAATGTIGRDFSFVQAKTYPAGSHPDWMRVAVDGNGELLLISGLAGGRTRIGFGQVDPDGTFIVWWQSEVALAHPDRLLGLPHAHAWLTTTTGPQPTSTVSLLRRGTVVGSRTWNESWTGMAVHGDLLAVYRGVRQFPIPTGTQTTPPHYEVCRVGPDHQITTVWNYEDFPPLIDNASGGDIDTPTGSLFYRFAIGSNIAEVRSLTERGFVRTAALGDLRQIVPDLQDTGLGWHSIAPC